VLSLLLLLLLLLMTLPLPLLHVMRRYGENPHQAAAFYVDESLAEAGKVCEGVYVGGREGGGRKGVCVGGVSEGCQQVEPACSHCVLLPCPGMALCWGCVGVGWHAFCHLHVGC
jgi:hypothetical protein